jgi:hypothetical protein
MMLRDFIVMYCIHEYSVPWPNSPPLTPHPLHPHPLHPLSLHTTPLLLRIFWKETSVSLYESSPGQGICWWTLDCRWHDWASIGTVTWSKLLINFLLPPWRFGCQESSEFCSLPQAAPGPSLGLFRLPPPLPCWLHKASRALLCVPLGRRSLWPCLFLVVSARKETVPQKGSYQVSQKLPTAQPPADRPLPKGCHHLHASWRLFCTF